MRRDEAGNPCPATLGEYRALFVEIWGEKSDAVKFIDGRVRETAFKQAVSLQRAAEALVPNSDLEMRVIALQIMKGKGTKK